MGEIFARESSGRGIAFTGERMTPDHTGQVEFEHLHRYFFAREFCRGKDVLDIASGEGYGSAYLAQVAGAVVGVELSEEMVAHAQASYRRPNLEFRQGDARHLAFPDDRFDVVISFETIEHFFDQTEFLDEIRRVLRPDGVLLISSPDRDIYSPVDGAVNPFHIKELSRREFEELIRERFPHCDFYTQRPMIGSTLLAESPRQSWQTSRTFERRGDTHFEASSGLPRAPYILAVAAGSPIPLGFDSLYIHTSDTDGPRREITDMRREQDAASRELSDMRREWDTASREAERMKLHLQAILASTSWRCTAPIRHIAGLLLRLRGVRR